MAFPDTVKNAKKKAGKGKKGAKPMDAGKGEKSGKKC